MERKVIVIAGPTCSGKTSVGISLAQKITGEIISADSRQIYKYLNIGTAKPSAEELKKIKHYFIDELEPDEDFNVSKFETSALKKIEELFEKNIQPVVVGGSGLYVKAIVDGIFDSVDTDESYRNQLNLLKNKFGNEYLYEELKKLDPGSASKMLPQNWKRIMRALEVYYLTGKTIEDHQQKHKRKIDIEFKQYGLEWERPQLYKNIESRVDKMIEAGLVDEVKNILRKGFDKKINALNTVGYKEIISYLDDEISFDKAVELIKRNTRRYAKRQMTWFRGDERIFWIKIDPNFNEEKIADFIIQREDLNERKN